ncbi:MAG: hypothetical protein LBS99_07185, partial [Clostridiales bacterium]|nr:hypothetical protein [Clostridiales bacterium]
MLITAAIFSAVKAGGGTFLPSFTTGAYISPSAMKEYLIQLARAQKEVRAGYNLPDLALIARKIKRAHKITDAKAAAGRSLFEFERWLYDNAYKLAEALDILTAGKNDWRGLPTLADGLPRVFAFAQAVVTHSDGVLEEAYVTACIEDYCSETPLYYEEIAVLPLAFRCALLARAVSICDKVITVNKMIDIARKSNTGLAADNIRFNSFIYGVSLYSSVAVKKRVAELCAENGQPIAARLANFDRQLIRYNTLAAAVIRSVNAVSVFMDGAYLRSRSQLNSILEGEKVGVYVNMAEDSREAYLREISRISTKMNMPEQYVGRHIVSLANAEGREAGYYLYENPVFGRKRLPKPVRTCVYIAALNIPAAAAGAVWGVFAPLPAAWRIITAALCYPLACAVIRELYALILSAHVRHRT